MNNILSKYRDRLVNIRRNNRTIKLNKLTKKFFDLSELCEYNFNEKNLINNIISNKESILFEIQKFKEPTEENLKQIDKEETIYKRFQKIKQEINLIRKTSGRHVGYIGYPFLEGKIEREWNGTIEETIIKAPLLLFPVDLMLDRRTQKVILVPQTDIEIQFNKSLAFAIEKYLGKTIDENDQIDIINAMTNKKFNLNRRIEKIINLLSKYMLISDETPKSTIEKFSDATYNERIFRIKNYMILGIFIQFSNAIAKDYDKLMELKDLGLINYVLDDDNAQYGFDAINIDDVSENEKYFVSEIDPSQETSIMSIVKSDNKGIVIHGPPGTGKSQTIVNLISQFVKDKKKVLMVCQKKTALDVVKNRLDAVGIKNAILIEDYVRDRNYALKEMENIIGESSSSCLRKDYKLQEVNNQIDEKLRELNELKEVLGKRYECGLSLFELYSKNNHKYNVIKEPKLRNIFLKYQHDKIRNSLNKLEKLLPYLKYDNNIMKIRKNWKDLSYVDRDTVEKYVIELMDLKTTIEKNNIPHPISEVYAHIEDIEKSIKLMSNIEINFQMSPQKLNILKYTVSRLHQLNIPHETYISLDDLIRYEQKPLKMKKKWEYLSNTDKNKIEKIVKELLNCRHKLNEYGELQHSIKDILNNINTLEEFAKLLETTEISEKIFETKISELKNQMSKIDKLNIPNNSYIPYDKLRDNEHHLIEYCKFMEKHSISRFLSKLFNSELKKSQLLVEEFEKITNLNYNELYDLHLSLKYLDVFFNDMPNSLTKDTYNEWINKKTKQLSLWELYYSLKSKISIPELNEEGKKEITQLIRKMIEYGLIYQKYIEYRNSFLEYFNFGDIPNDEELHIILENLEEFEKIRDYEILKNKVKDWDILINSLDEEFFKDIPKEITKNNIENWITKKIGYLQLWELYYKLKDKFNLSKLSGENKNVVLDELKRLEEHGKIYPKYIEIQQALSKYLKNVESLSYRELNEILVHLAEFDDIKYYDTLKNDINSNEMELLKYLNKYSKYELMNTYYYTWIDYIENKPQIFKVVKKIDEYNHIKKELEELYEIKLLKTRKYIQKILKRINIGDEAKIKIPYESNKKRRRKPLKEIIDLYENDVFNIAPVWLTTPDVVSAIFPLKKELFDIVIYDEASQMPVEYAIPSLYRAKRFVVAGDEKQLPPTDFFKASFDEDDDEIEGIGELEVKSLLELCKTRCPTVLLSFHYRAKYEEIINFSNYAYYNGKIAISPNKHRGKPFEFVKVNGIWENRKNHVEAKKVVEKVYELLKKNSEKSIGIITFNSEHKDLIMDELEKKALKDERFKTLYEKSLNLKKDNEDMSLFVRNIENVQGDERDIIIFSTAYAKDENDKLNHNFGPLNKVGGENRLNVAITRAKEKVIIITSIEPEELKVEHLKNEGPKLLKKYMQYVKFISNGDYANAEIILNSLCDVEQLNELQFDSPFEEEVYNELTKRGHIVHTQVGCSKYRIDLAIKHPKEDKYILGIECDGATYHSSRSAKERDLYRQRFLEMKGWKIIRIWSRNWWKNREKEIHRIEQGINRNL